MAIRGIDFKWLVTLLSLSLTLSFQYYYFSLISIFIQSNSLSLSLLSGTMDFSFPCSPPVCILFQFP
jgi:hypothetical protein